jgi:ABC-type branched-subunit amino acid transport system substrate-binding protein
LGRAEGPLVEAALRRVPPARFELRRRLEVRALLLDPKAARRAGRDAVELEALRPRVTVYRVAALLPDRGDYAGYAASVAAGVRAGLAWRAAGGPRPIALEFHGTGEGEIARGMAALDTVARTCGAVVGDLLSPPTTALAAATRVLGLPLVSTMATDESIGRIGPAVFQVGPASLQRGECLARAVIPAPGTRVAILTSNAEVRGPFTEAFAAAAESLGASVVRRDHYPPGAADFRNTARSLKAAGAQVLFWDGDSREADALLHQLATAGMALRICGGTALAPEQFHAGSRVLLEGVTWVADDWRLAAEPQALLDSLARARGERSGPLWVRGFLAGRRIADAVGAGARTPAELAARLRHPRADLRAWGFLDCAADGATLPVFTVARGRAVEVPPAQ